MLRYTSTLFAVLATGVVSGQQPETSPKSGTGVPAVRLSEADKTDAQRKAQSDRGSIPRNEIPAGSEGGSRSRDAAQGDETASFDAGVADCLILGNQEEVLLLKFGIERTKNNDVKAAAQKMLKDHETAVTELRQFSSKKHAGMELTLTGGSSPRAGASRDVQKANADDSSTSGFHENSGALTDKMHRMAHRTAQECLRLTKDELSKFSGQEFDQAFVGSQIGAHIGMLAQLKAAETETSPKLSQWTIKAQETTKMHKEHLQDLMDSISKNERGKN